MKKNKNIGIRDEDGHEDNTENILIYNVITVIIILLFLFTLVISWLCLT